MADIGSSTWSETAASNNAVSPNGFKSGTMLPSETEPVGRELMSALKKWWNRSNGVKTSAGTNTVTLTYDIAEAGYYTGQFFLFKAGGTNTGSTTLNVSGLGAKTVQLAGRALLAGDMTSGFYYGAIYDGTNFQLFGSSRFFPTPGAVNAFPADPTPRAGALVMMGLGASCYITPTRSGTVKFEISGLTHNSTAGSGVTIRLWYGTGTPPANAAAVTGTQISAEVAFTNTNADFVPFTVNGVVSGLTVGTVYWFDLSLGIAVSGTASVISLTGNALES